MSPELLAQFGWTAEEKTDEDNYEDYGIEECTEFLETSPLAELVDDEEINSLCAKYKIKIQSWLKLATEVMDTQEMMVA